MARHRSRLGIAMAGLLTVALAAPASALAQDGIVKVRESAFNELADRIEPIALTGHRTLTVSIPTPFGTARITVCDSDWTATVSGIDFDISPARIQITGDVSAVWCGLSFSGVFTTDGDATYSAAQNAVVMTVQGTSIRPQFTVWGVTVNLPAINVGPTFNLPPLPIGAAFARLETVSGPIDLTLTAQNVAVTKRNGLIELQSDVVVW